MYDKLEDETPVFISLGLMQQLTEANIYVSILTDAFDEIQTTIAMDSAEEQYVPLNLLAHLLMTSSLFDKNMDEIFALIPGADQDTVKPILSLVE